TEASATPTTLQRSEVGLRRSEKGISHSNKSLTRSDIDESLNALNDQPVPKKAPRKKDRRVRKPKQPVSRRKRIIKRIVIVLLLIGLVFGGWVAYKVISNGSSVFKGGLLGLVQTQPLKQDSNGRSNILV